MHKFFAAIVLVLSNMNLLQAQDGYVKFNTDADFRNNSIKCFRGEIVPFVKSVKTNKISVIVGKDTITDLPIQSKSFNTIENPNTAYLSTKEDLVQLQKGGLVYINASSISAADTVTVISEKRNQITQLISKREAQVNQSECGKTFRLIITNTPTIYYNSNSLKQFVEPVKPIDETETTSNKETEKGFFDSLAWWHYLLFVLALGGIGFVVWKFFLKKAFASDLKEVYVTYNGNSLKEFASDNGITLSELIKFNKRVIDKKYEHYDDRDRKQVHKDLKNRKLLVRYQPKSTSENFNNLSDSNYNEKKEQPPIIEDWDNPQESFVPPSTQGGKENISQLIRQLKSDLIQEIRMSASRSSDNTNQINSLNQQIRDLKSEKNNLDIEKQNLDSKIAQLKNDKANLDRDLQNVTSTKNHIASELNQLQEKVIAVDYLTGYCDSVLSYLKLCQEVSSEAYDYFNRTNEQYLGQANGAVPLLINFQNSINSIPVGNWIQILQDIRDTGVTNNQKIKNCFKQPTTAEDKKREFQRLLFSEVLVKYSSTILILAEAFRNISRFQLSSELGDEIQNCFAKHVSELVSKVKSTGLENKYVPLFKNFEEFLGHTELANRERSLAYKGIVGIEKEAIVEIVSYGVKTAFEETKTLIILA